MKKTRRDFLKLSALSAALLSTDKSKAAKLFSRLPAKEIKPIVLSTWKFGIEANAGAWEILKNKGRALDAVEAGVKIIEGDPNQRSVGLGGKPDRDGHTTLDACIMDEFSNIGSVAFLEQIEHPISVARAVMEKTPHVMLVGEGALQFALAQGFPRVKEKNVGAQAEWKEWLKKSEYKPQVNIENHDTIGMIALDTNGNLSRSLHH